MLVLIACWICLYASAFVINGQKPSSWDCTKSMSTESTYADTCIEDDMESLNTMIPLSEKPLILVSQRPLLSPEECKKVARYLEMNKDGSEDPLNDVFFKDNGRNVFSTAHISKVNNENSLTIEEENVEAFYEEARSIIYRVRSEIDRLTNSPSHEGDFALPRFLSFKVDEIPDPSKDGVQQTINSIIPDGLHCDNVNNQFTRHISALLYLSDEIDESEEEGLVGGHTTFPLAKPLHQRDDEKTAFDERVEEAARNHLNANRLHSGQRDWPNAEGESTILEAAAYSLFHREISRQNTIKKVPDTFLPKSSRGVRITPRPGQLCIFHNLLDDGSPDPLAFHAGEAILGRSPSKVSGKKVLLVFFKTINLQESEDKYMQELAQKSKASRQWIKDQYYN